MREMYHCFWVNPFGNDRKYESTSDLERVQELVQMNNSGDDSNVRYLRVIYGELLEFEPVEVVTRWKIKYDESQS